MPRALLGKGCSCRSPLGLEMQLCPARGCVEHQVLCWGQRRAQPPWHSRTGQLCQALLSLSAIPGISQGTATAWRGFGHSVCCCSPACCRPALRGARPAPAPTSVCRWTPWRHRPSTTLPGEGSPGPGCFTAGAGAALAPQDSPLSALPRATREQKSGGAQELSPRTRCIRCCEPLDQRFYPQYQPLPQINMTILKGEDLLGLRAQNLQSGHCSSVAPGPAQSWGPSAGAARLWAARVTQTGSKGNAWAGACSPASGTGSRATGRGHPGA